MWQKLSGIILRNRVAILICIGLLTCVFLWSTLTQLKLDNKYGNTLPKDAPAQNIYQKFQKIFGADGGTMVVAIQSKWLYTQKNFLKWRQLGDSIAAMPGVTRVISEANLLALENDKVNKRFVAHPVFSDFSYQEKSIQQIKKEIRSNPLYEDILYNPKSEVSLMMISVDESYVSDKTKSKVVFQIEDLAKSYEKSFGKVYFAGLPHIRVIIGKRVLNEMYFFIGLAILVISTLLWLYFRSIRIVLICNFIVSIAVIWSLGTIGLIGYKLSILMALIPPLVIIIGIPSCVYLLNRYHQEIKLHGNKVKAINRVIAKTGNATFMASSTTIIGFFCFSFTNSEKLTEFGLAASLDILLLFCLAICLVPIISFYSKTPEEKELKHLENKATGKILDRVINLTVYKRVWIYVITIVVVAISGYGITKIESTGNITGDLPKNDPILTDMNFIQDNFKGAIPFEIMVNYKKNARLFNPTTLKRVEAVQNLFAHDKLFSKSLSIVDFVKFVNMSFYDNNPAKYELFSRRDMRFLKEYLENMQKDKAKNSSLDLKQLVDTSNTLLRIRMQLKDIGSYEVEGKVARLTPKIDSLLNPDKKILEGYFQKYETGKKNYVDSIVYGSSEVYNNLTRILSNGNSKTQYEFDLNPDKIKHYYSKPNFKKQLRAAIDESYYSFDITGTSVVAAEGAKFLVYNLFESLFYAILIICVLMLLLFNSFRMLIISVFPNLIPAVVTAGIMGFFHIPIKPSTVVVFSIALGISVDNTIYFLSRYRQELKFADWDLRICTINSMKYMGLSMFYSSSILFFGFFVFSFSQFGGTKVLGILVGLTLLVDVAMNLLLVPSLLQTLNKRYIEKAFREPLFDIFNEEEDIEFEHLTIEKDASHSKSGNKNDEPSTKD